MDVGSRFPVSSTSKFVPLLHLRLTDLRGQAPEQRADLRQIARVGPFAELQEFEVQTGMVARDEAPRMRPGRLRGALQRGPECVVPLAGGGVRPAPDGDEAARGAHAPPPCVSARRRTWPSTKPPIRVRVEGRYRPARRCTAR